MSVDMTDNMLMKRISFGTLKDIKQFNFFSDTPIPSVPKGGARVKVHYAGVCYIDTGSAAGTPPPSPTLKGIRDTSLFPGYEVAGIIDALDPDVPAHGLEPNDRVIVYPFEGLADIGYPEYLAVPDIRYLVKVPKSLPLKIAAMLPTGALWAINCIQKAKPIVESFAKSRGYCNVVIVGAGGLSLWILKVAKYYISNDDNRVHIYVADTEEKRLNLAREQGSHDGILWSDELHEEALIERTKNSCKTGVHVVIDYATTTRSCRRALKYLDMGGVMFVGGKSNMETNIDMRMLARRQQNIMGVNRGNLEQLKEVVRLVAEGKISVPCYQVFPFNQASEVFDKLTKSQINGRAILEFNAE